MVSNQGGLNTAKTLINSKEPSIGYTELWRRKRLDVTVEAVVLENKKWHPLFENHEIENSHKRLIEHGYKPKEL